VPCVLITLYFFSATEIVKLQLDESGELDGTRVDGQRFVSLSNNLELPQKRIKLSTILVL